MNSASQHYHVATIECSLSLSPLSRVSARSSLVTHKKTVVTVGREPSREISLKVQILGSKQKSVSYRLKDSTVHTKFTSAGKGSIEVRNSDVVLFLFNAIPFAINIFLKCLQAKLELILADRGLLKTPGKVNWLTEFTPLSPLREEELRRIRQLRGQFVEKIPVSPLPRSPSKSNRLLAPSVTKRLFVRENAIGTALPGSLKLKEKVSGFSLNTVSLSEEQLTVLHTVVEGKENVFFTGAAGTGKSVLLQSIIKRLPRATTQVTASTGVAACQIGGVTLHSFAGFDPSSTATKEAAIKRILSSKDKLRRWREITHLVIDEISIVDARFFSLLEAAARGVRSSDRPFGGIQLVITGDFLQLPPVLPAHVPLVFCFQCAAWRRSISRTILLREGHRQKADDGFIGILNQIRMGSCDEKCERVLKETNANYVWRGSIIPTRLCTHSKDAADMNSQRLDAIKEDVHVFHAEDTGTVVSSLLRADVPLEIHLKKGAQVMLTKNIDLSRGLSNGARGIVKEFARSSYPVVTFKSTGEDVEIRPFRYTVGEAKDTGSRAQLPLCLAWGISIHKSQGLTLDAVEVDLRKSFAPGQAYVALSRATSLASLRVENFDARHVRADEQAELTTDEKCPYYIQVVEYYKKLEAESTNKRRSQQIETESKDKNKEILAIKRRRTE